MGGMLSVHLLKLNSLKGYALVFLASAAQCESKKKLDRSGDGGGNRTADIEQGIRTVKESFELLQQWAEQYPEIVQKHKFWLDLLDAYRSCNALYNALKPCGEILGARSSDEKFDPGLRELYCAMMNQGKIHQNNSKYWNGFYCLTTAAGLTTKKKEGRALNFYWLDKVDLDKQISVLLNEYEELDLPKRKGTSPKVESGVFKDRLDAWHQ